MSLAEELSWRGFVNQTTLKDIHKLDSHKFTFYLGIDPSSDSMTIGNLAIIMMIKHFINYGHKPILLVGGATGLIGDPDGKVEERALKTNQQIINNKQAIAKQYRKLFNTEKIQIVDNYDWFQDFNYLEFLRQVGKHVPMRQMLARDFVEKRLSNNGKGISYAEFSYVLIQAYDFLYLHQNYNVDMQICGSDQWGNCIAGVDLIRRITNHMVDVWSAPLIVNPVSGIKFGKSEEGAIWLDPAKTSPTAFYQFWINTQDEAIEKYLKIYTTLSKSEIESIVSRHKQSPKSRLAQYTLADHVCELVHGKIATQQAKQITEFLTGKIELSKMNKEQIKLIKQQIITIYSQQDGSIAQALVNSKLTDSNSRARQLIKEGAIYINNQQIKREFFLKEDYVNEYLLLRRGKSYKDCALIELKK